MAKLTPLAESFWFDKLTIPSEVEGVYLRVLRGLIKTV
jgi:hypothetical protein